MSSNQRPAPMVNTASTTRPQSPPQHGMRPPVPPVSGMQPPNNAIPPRPAYTQPAGVPIRPVYGQPMQPARPAVALGSSSSGVVPPQPNFVRPHPTSNVASQTMMTGQPVANTHTSPPSSANTLVSPIQHMNLNHQHPNVPLQKATSKRVYPSMASGPATTAPNVPAGAPWPHGLGAHQQPVSPMQQQQQRPAPPQSGSMTSPHSSSSRSASAGVGYTQGPFTHTQQNLPPELRPPQQPRPRIDPDQMPAPVQVREQDQQIFGDKFFGTLERDRVPLATTDYIGLDQGNCNPRYMRSTMDKIPFSKDLLDTSKLPLGLVVQPLAKPKKDEVPIQVVDLGEEGPIRCNRCRAYISPWCAFTHGGSRFECSICSHSNEVPSWYFSNLDMSGRRVDMDQRPELRYGSVEFAVPAEYNSSRTPAPLNYVFAIDVSAQAVRSGMVQAACNAIKHALYGPNTSKLAAGNKIGLLTFDRSVHFYNLAAGLSQAQMLVVADIQDMFIPLEHGFLVDPIESQDIITDLLDSIPHLFKDAARPEAAFVSAVQGGLLALTNNGGNLFVFQSVLPNHGRGVLPARDDKALYNTDKEKSLLNPQNDTYKELADECVKNAVCVHTWLFPAQYIDVATLGVMSSLTGGDVRYYPNFTPNEAGKISYQLDHDLHREAGFDGVLRIRCSDGLQVVDHYGNCHMSTYTDMDLAGIDQDKAMAAVLKHDSKLDVNRNVCFQMALLYTTKTGQRRVRVHNLSLPVSGQIAEVFRSGDEDTTVSIMLRKAIFDLQHKSRKAVQEKITEESVGILTAYRTNCAATTSAGQLILPEAFKLLPVYMHASMRSQALRGVGVDVNTDVRVSSMKLLNSLGVADLVTTLYPRLYSVSDMKDDEGISNLRGEVKLPPMVRTSYERLNPTGAYLLDTGSDLYFWLGSKVSSDFLQGVFGVSNLQQVDVNMTNLPVLDNPLSERIQDISRQLQLQRPRYLQLRIVRQEMDAIEFVFSTWMAEDRNAEVQTYVDYMCVLHRKIQEEMKKHSNY
ncbi:hypothetical protein K492DRAFT_210828 [Lichtheimia hyalospora FSU 10163]|nr:hypothetical protein K492DRAFT_210828 [Lichtheimia hyalospora FSU 10163]